MAARKKAQRDTAPQPYQFVTAEDGTVKAMYRLVDLTLDPDNARQHDSKDLTAISDSLLEFGQQKPIVIDADGIVRAGNGTCLALRDRGDKLVWGVASTLRGPAAARYGYADNRTAELSQWDYRKLGAGLRALQEAGENIDNLGWTDYELEPLLRAEWKPKAVDPDITAGSLGKLNATLTVTFDTPEDLAKFHAVVAALGEAYGTPGIAATLLRALRDAKKALKQ